MLFLMSTVTDHDQRLAATLTSLSLERRHITQDPPYAPRRRTAPLLSLALLAATSLIIVVYRPAVFHPSGTPFSSMPALRSEPRATETSRVEDTNERNNKPDVINRQVGEITGSGIVVAPRSTTVFSKYEARITDVAVELGDRVEAG